jgi:Cu(I)/Ag(I) efflux system membrane fusion protein
MSALKISIVAAIALVVGIGAGIWWSQRSISNPSDAPGGRKALYWHDPMVPGQKFDKAGKSPFMDMQLVPVYADEAGKDAGIKVSSNVMQSLGIRIGRVERATLEQQFNLVGSVVYDERLVRAVQARVSGYVTKLFVKAPFERVRQGQSLADITSPEWRAAQEEYLALLKSNSDSVNELRIAARERLLILDVPEAVIAAIERTRSVIATTTITAPIDGVLTELAVREGAAFPAGAPLFRINGLATVWVNAQIPEAQLPTISAGTEVIARAPASPGDEFTGRVQALLPEVDTASRVFTVRAEFDNRKQKLSPGMFVSIALRERNQGLQLVVPTEAIIMTGQRNVVIQMHDDGSFKIVDVVIGAQSGGRTVLASGLNEGDSIVISGQFLIDSEASLKSTVDRLTGMESNQKGSPP